MQEESMIKKERPGFDKEDIRLICMIISKTKDVYNFFSYLNRSKGLNFAIVLIKSDNLKNKILKEKRKTDIYIDLEREDMNLIILPEKKRKECNGFTRRIMSEIKEGSGDFASILQITKKIDLEEAIFTLLVDYLHIIKQPLEWRTGHISYNKL